MHRILVEEKRWIGEARFLHALNYCMLLPGPEAQQLAIYIGWLLHRVPGGLLAGLLFILPGFLAIMGLSLVYVTLGGTGLVQGLFFGLKAAVLAIVAQAVLRLGRRALGNRAMAGIAAAAFVAIFALGVPFPAIVLAAGLAGLLGGLARHPAFLAATGHGAGGPAVPDRATALGEGLPPQARPGAKWWLKVVGLCLILWLGPVLLLLATLGSGNVFSQMALFFSRMALVTFGGAYAVLAYVAQAGVETYGWLRPGEMLDGLGMAETTPGPLIMVVQFVGFLGAYREPGALPPLVAGVLGGVLATWVTFVPCFLWIFAGAPFVEGLRGNRALAAGLKAITAAVVGVILNLAIWFALHALFARTRGIEALGLHLELPVPASVNLPLLLLTAAAFLAVFGLRLGMAPVLGACAAAGIIYRLALAGP